MLLVAAWFFDYGHRPVLCHDSNFVFFITFEHNYYEISI